MDSVDLDVLKHSVQWMNEGHKVLLVTVVHTWGSSPRPVGAMLAIREDGRVAGSVSGGCIEDDLILNVQRTGIVQSRPDVLTYGIDADQAHRFGLPCGGTIELVTEPLFAGSNIAELLAGVLAGKTPCRSVDMHSGHATIASAVGDAQLSFDGDRLVNVHGPRYRLLVIGCGQLSRYLCQMALGLDFQVTVCDPRSEYMDAWDVDGVTLLRTMPDDTVDDMLLDARCAVVAVTHDPKLDDLALMQALKTPAFYVGALGSRKNNHLRRERLRQFDVTEEEISHLHGPVGIFIGSKTPAEIAISIIAEIVAVKNGVAIPKIWSVEGAKSTQQDSMPAADNVLQCG